MTAKTASKGKKSADKAETKKAPKVAEKSKVVAKETKAVKPVKAAVKPEVKTVPSATEKPVLKSAKVETKKIDQAEIKSVVKPAVAPKVIQKSAVSKSAAKPEAPKASVAPKAPGKDAPVAHGIGRRKAAVARVWLRRNGSGKITVNKMPAQQYFSTDTARRMIKVPSFVVPAVAARYDVDVNVYGGGVHGQADAVKLALSRALVKVDEAVRPALKEKGLLRVDARVVERKKFGQKKARRRFQFVKR